MDRLQLAERASNSRNHLWRMLAEWLSVRRLSSDQPAQGASHRSAREALQILHREGRTSAQQSVGKSSA